MAKDSSNQLSTIHMAKHNTFLEIGHSHPSPNQKENKASEATKGNLKGGNKAPPDGWCDEDDQMVAS